MNSLVLRTAAWYGDREVAVDLPDSWQVQLYEPRTPPPLTNEEIRAAFECPHGQRPIRELAAGCRRPCIIVDDLTRPTPAARVVPYVLEQLFLAGIPAEEVTIVLAKGSHGPICPGTWERKIGGEAAARCRLHVHEYDRDLARIGRTSQGTPVVVNRVVAAADFLFGVGGIYPQHTTGFGGGSKLSLGVLGRASIVALHYGHASMEGSGEVDNSFRRDLDEIAAMIGLRTMASVHVDAKREIVRLVTGDHALYYPEAIAFSHARYGVSPPTGADVVICNAYPQDVSLTFMRSKGLGPVLRAPGGASRIVVSANSEGVGLHRLFPFLNGPRWNKHRQRARRLMAQGPALLTRALVRRTRAVRMPTIQPRRKHPIHLYATGPIPAQLPPETELWRGSGDRLVTTADWGEVLASVQAEQGQGNGLKVAVYPCASIQVLEREAR